MLQVNLVLNQQCLSLKLNLLLTPRHVTFVMYTFPHSGLVKISDCLSYGIQYARHFYKFC